MSISKIMTLLSLTATPAFAGVVDQESFDVRLVAAQITGTVIGVGEGQAAQVQLTSCKEISRRPQWHTGVHIYDDVEYDCVEALSAYVGAPLLGYGRIYTAMQKGTSKMVNPGIAKSGRRVDLYTAVRDAALAPAKGIGFYYAWESRFIPKNKLSTFTHATDWNGDAVTVQRFAGFFTGPAFESVSFKPYVRYDDQGVEFRNWENVEPHAGSGEVTGSFGTGNYMMTAQTNEEIRFTDVIREMDRIPVAAGTAPARLQSETFATDITTITHDDGKVEAEVALFPSAWGYDLQWDPKTLQVEAGKEVWFRYEKNLPQGQAVKLFYKVGETGVEVEAMGLLGGNCHPGFDGCFQMEVPADAHGTVYYRFDRGGQGSFKIVDRATSTTLRYDAQRALDLTANAGLVPESFTIDVVYKTADGDKRFPLGSVSSWRDELHQLVYNARMAELKIDVPAHDDVFVVIKTWGRFGEGATVVDRDPNL